MTGPELAERLRMAHLTADELGQRVNRHQDEVSGWLASERPLPKSLTRELDWHLAVYAREQQMRESGLPTCDWVQRHEQAPAPDIEKLEKRLIELEAHAKTCAICQEREAYAETLPALPPMPMAPHLRLLGRLAEAVSRLPQWARPAAVGALLVGALTLFRAILMTVLQRAPVTLELVLTILAAIGLGAYGGLVGGVAYSLVRNPTRRLGRLGDYVTGVACVHAYLAAFGIPAALFTKEEMFRSVLGWAILLIGGSVIGLIIGHTWFRTSVAPEATQPAHADRGQP